MDQNEDAHLYRLLPARERGPRSKVEISGAEDAVDACFLAGGTLKEAREVFRKAAGEGISLDALSRHRKLLFRRTGKVEMMELFLEIFLKREEEIRKGLVTPEELARRVEEADRELIRRLALRTLAAEERILRARVLAELGLELGLEGELGGEDPSPGGGCQ